MSPFFYKNIPSRQKALVIYVFSWLGLSIYGISSNFVAERWVEITSLYFSLPISLTIFIPLFLYGIPENKLYTAGTIKRLFSFSNLLTMTFLYFTIWAGLAFGGALIFTNLFGNKHIGEFVVTWKSDGQSRNRECTYAISVQSSGSGWHSKNCVGKKIWQSATIGDKVMAKGKYSSLGGVIEEIYPP